jgi:hypothetical protein
MAVIEVVTFRLAPGVDEDRFRDADQRAQTEFVYGRPGVLRRTTARGADGEWLVVTLWGSAQDADASAAAARDDAAMTRWDTCVDGSTVTTRRFDTLD